MKIFETHSHYDDSAFDDDRDELISQMLSDNGELEYLINVGASLDGCKKSLELADKYDKVYAAVGVHPEDVGNLTMHDIQWLKKQETAYAASNLFPNTSAANLSKKVN